MFTYVSYHLDRVPIVLAVADVLAAREVARDVAAAVAARGPQPGVCAWGGMVQYIHRVKYKSCCHLNSKQA